MKKKEYKKTIQSVLKQLRKTDACILAIEEISELTSELILILNGRGSKQHLCEEISDVYITVELIMGVYGISKKDVNSYKRKHLNTFLEYSKAHGEKFNIDSTIAELSLLQKLLCKKARGRHAKPEIIRSIAAVQMSLDYMEELNIVKHNDVLNWRCKKFKRLRKRAQRGGVV